MPGSDPGEEAKDPARTRQNELKKMVKYWAGAEPDVKSDAERKQMHEENVTAFLKGIRDTTRRRLQPPKWVKDRRALAEVEEQAALGLRASPHPATPSGTQGADGEMSNSIAMTE